MDGNAQSTLISGTELSDEETAAILGAGQLTTGVVWVSLENTAETTSPQQLARFRDALLTMNATFGPFGISLVEVETSEVADVRVQISADSPCGGFADGVLGCATGAGDITLVTGWDWYTDASTASIATSQYDFQTVITHEIGHTIGLAHSSDANSVMYRSLAPGVARRALTAVDLKELEDDGHTSDSDGEALYAERAAHPSNLPLPSTPPMAPAYGFDHSPVARAADYYFTALLAASLPGVGQASALPGRRNAARAIGAAEADWLFERFEREQGSKRAVAQRPALESDGAFANQVAVGAGASLSAAAGTHDNAISQREPLDNVPELAELADQVLQADLGRDWLF